MPSSYVLLNHCGWNDEGYNNIVVKLLSTEHPFATLLLKRGARPHADKHDYVIEMWRPFTMRYCGTFVDKWGFRREQATWPSAYGPPSEEHLQLFHCIEAWIRSQERLAVGEFDKPCSVLGHVWLDHQLEYDGSGITSRNPSMGPAVTYEGRDEQGETQQMTVPIEFAWTDVELQQNKAVVEAIRQYDEYVSNGSPPGSEHGSPAAGGFRKAVASEGAVCHEPVDYRGTDQSIGNGDCASQPGDVAEPWEQSPCLLKDIVLSCSQEEVQDLLTAFSQREAHKQVSKFKAELLQLKNQASGTSM